MAIQDVNRISYYGEMLAYPTDENTILTVYNATTSSEEDDATLLFGGEGVTWWPTTLKNQKIIIVEGTHSLTTDGARLLTEREE